jgi:Flp pilus assembly pilin Flp
MYKKLKNEDGAMMVEFALIAFVFFFVLLGLIEFGLLLYNQQVITNAATEGARYGIVTRSDDHKIDSGDIEDAVSDYAESHIITFGDKNFVVTATFPDPCGEDPDGEPLYCDYCGEFQNRLTVVVTCEYSFLFLPYVKKPLEATAVMLCESG